MQWFEFWRPSRGTIVTNSTPSKFFVQASSHLMKYAKAPSNIVLFLFERPINYTISPMYPHFGRYFTNNLSDVGF